MVTALNPFDDEKKKTEEEQAAATAPKQISTGTQSSGTIGSSPASPSATPTSSGRYTNLSAFLNANKGFNQGQGLAGKIVSNVQSAADQQGQQLGQAQQQFGQTSTEGAKAFTVPGQAPTMGVPGQTNVQNAQAFTQQSLASPTKATPDSTQQFGNLLNASYKGPKSLQDVEGAGALQSNTANIQNLAKGAQTGAGRFDLLRKMFGNSNYSRGQQNLDSLLLGSDKSQLKNLQGTQRIAGVAGQKLQSAQQEAAKTAQDYSNQANEIQTGTREALGKTVSDFDAKRTQAAIDAGNTRNLNVSKARTNLSAGELSPEDMAKYALQNQNIYNTSDLGQYLEASGMPATKQNVSSAEDYGRIEALRNLAGGYSNEDLSRTFSDYGNANEAGKFNAAGDYVINKDRLKNAAQTQKSAMEAEIADQASLLQSRLHPQKGTVYLQRKGGLTPQQIYDTELAKIAQKYQSGRTLGTTSADIQRAPTPLTIPKDQFSQ